MAKIVFKELTSDQNILFPVSLSEKIAANHPVRVVNQVVYLLDISSLLSKYKGGGTSIFILFLQECRRFAEYTVEFLVYECLVGL